jgi:ATP-dependent Lon protease
MPRKAASTEAVQKLPLLPLRNSVVFPFMTVPLLVGRPASVAAVEESLSAGAPLFLCAQVNPDEDDPTPKTMFRMGVAARIVQTLRVPDGSLKVVVEGLGRGAVQRFHLDREVPAAEVIPIHSTPADPESARPIVRLALELFEKYVKLSQRLAPDILVSIQGMSEAAQIVDTIAGYLSVSVEERQELLEIVEVQARLEKLCMLIHRENELIELERKVQRRVRDQMDRGHREHFLQEQLKVIQHELGHRGTEEGGDEFSELRLLIQKAKMPKEVREKAEKELSRYTRMPFLSPESAVIRTYLEWLCDMPWSRRTKDQIDLAFARAVLDKDHYGLEKVKERIIEYLAVRKLNPATKGPILCLVGPPGVGKTSLGESIAQAMKRKFVRVSLGGVRDEAEIRGHRRTYIGALPGRIIQSMKKVGVRNPVFMLDEVDKMSGDFRGDPASALLEVLDPAQNKAFSDHYMEVDFDLSEVFFIATANSEYDIPYALHDRMEVIHLSGYTQMEKERIARLFLIPRQTRETGLKKSAVEIDDAALDTIIQRYTREAGVRELERMLAKVFRKVARRVVSEGSRQTIRIGTGEIEEMLGPPPYLPLSAELEGRVGVAIGMAWTQAGGDILTIECTTMPGKGKLTLTGKLGEVMKESAEAAYSYLRANADRLGVDHDLFRKKDVHVHVPEGAIPKDGPSAGVALLTALLSALRAVPPSGGIAMTGEITLRGRVLAVGGIKEKVLAAHRAGIRHVILPKQNEKDFPDIPAEVREEMAFSLIERVEELFALTFRAPGE